MRTHAWRIATAVIGVSIASLSGQSLPRVAASLPVILRNPVFFHGRSVALIGSVIDVQGRSRLAVPAPQTLVITWKDGRPPDGPVEIRGLFFDIGRFAEDDSRLAVYGIPAIVRAVSGETWPTRETLFVIIGATWAEAPASRDVSIRSLSLAPEPFDGSTITLRGRFRGQNLFGDVATWPRQSQWDFVLQAADAAVWVTGLRPRGPKFDFDPKSRRNTNRWLEVTGVVHTDHGLPFVAATKLNEVEAAAEELTADPAPEPPPALPPPAVVFSAPTDGEINVSPAFTVRLQFSRAMAEASFKDKVRVRYTSGAAEAVPKFTVTYLPGSSAVQITFATPLARFAEVQIDFLEGITAREGAPLPPRTLRFTTGGL